MKKLNPSRYKNEETGKLDFIDASGLGLGERYKVIHIAGQEQYLVKRAVKFKKDMNYLVVVSERNSYSQTKPYTIKKTFSNILAESPDGKYKVYYDATRKDYYVNSSIIDVSYAYHYNFNDGYSRTDMTVKQMNKIEFAIDSNDNKSFVFGDYTTTWPTDKTYHNVLKVAVNNIDGYIHRSNGGLHNDP